MKAKQKLYMASFFSFFFGLCLMHSLHYYSTSKLFAVTIQLEYQEKLDVYGSLLAHLENQNAEYVTHFLGIALEGTCEAYEKQSKEAFWDREMAITDIEKARGLTGKCN